MAGRARPFRLRWLGYRHGSPPRTGAGDAVLDGAIAPVLRDLRSAGIAGPRIEYRDWMRDPQTSSAMLCSPDGSSTGVQVPRTAPQFERVAIIADQVQDWVIDELRGHAPTNWPRCPLHPDSHPMRVSTRGAAAVWTCPADGIVISPVGEL